MNNVIKPYPKVKINLFLSETYCILSTLIFWTYSVNWICSLLRTNVFWALFEDTYFDSSQPTWKAKLLVIIFFSRRWAWRSSRAISLTEGLRWRLPSLQNLFAITSSKNYSTNIAFVCWKGSFIVKILGVETNYNCHFSSFDCCFCQASGTEPIPGRLEVLSLWVLSFHHEIWKWTLLLELIANYFTKMRPWWQPRKQQVRETSDGSSLSTAFCH